MHKVYLGVLTFIFHLFGAISFSDIQEDPVEKFANNLDFKTAAIGLSVVDLSNNKVLADLQAQKAFIPASTQKLITTMAAIELLGADFRFKTEIGFTGIVNSEGVLNGNIIVKGGGDPTLGSPLFSNEEDVFDFVDDWCGKIKDAGIKGINGKLIIDVTIFSDQKVPRTWIWEDIGNYYGAAPWGLSIHDNTYRLVFKSPNRPNMPVEVVDIKPEIPYLKVVNHVVSQNISYDNAYIFGMPENNRVNVRGSIPMDKERFIVKGAIPNPPLFFGDLLVRKLNLFGIKGLDNAIEIVKSAKHKCGGYSKLYVHYSPTLSEIVEQINMKSVNLYAEHLTCFLGKQNGIEGNTKEGCKQIIQFIEKSDIKTKGLFLEDGSGLSHFNLISPKQMVDCLVFMKKKSSNFDHFCNSLPIAGISGSLKNRFNTQLLRGNLRAKSGYMKRVISYAGYFKTQKGRELAFSVMVNNYDCENWRVRKNIETLLDGIAKAY